MSPRSVAIAVLALTFGGSAAVGVNILYKQQGSAASVETVPVVVAKVDIPRGYMISADKIKVRNFPKDLAPAGAITQEADALGRVAFHSLVKDEPLVDPKLSPKHSKGGLAALVPPGMRAFTIQTPHVATHVAGFILPGNKVDVLLTMNGLGPNDQTGGGVTTTLLQSVEILAVDQRLDAPTENRVDPKSLQSVTLLVTPDQAAKLDLGQNRGTLHLSLRNPTDTKPAATQPATLSGLQFHQEKPWGEQLSQVIETFAKVTGRRAGETKKATEPETPRPPQAAPAPLEIRTLRGTHPGVVLVESPPSAASR